MGLGDEILCVCVTITTYIHQYSPHSPSTTTLLWAAAAGAECSSSWLGVRGGAAPTTTSSSSSTTDSAAAVVVGAEAEGEEQPRDMRIPITLVSGFLGACLGVCIDKYIGSVAEA